MTFPDAKAWALRNWPDMNIYDDEELPNIIACYHRIRTFDFRCITVEVDDDLVVFFPLFAEKDPRSTPYAYKELPETEGGLRFKAWLFKNQWDSELAAKTKWTTVADPYFDWRREERARAREAAFSAARRK